MTIPAEARLIEWNRVSAELALAKENYRRTYSTAYIASEQKTADGKKNEADSKTSELRIARDLLETQATFAWELYQLAKQGEAA